LICCNKESIDGGEFDDIATGLLNDDADEEKHEEDAEEDADEDDDDDND
jgi:hypothetical protein